MTTEIYIKRQLHLNGQNIMEDKLLSSLTVAVVLAEPGAGKTSLLNSLAKALNVKPIRASIFKHKRMDGEPDALVIDALDEVARIGEDTVSSVIVKAQETGATKIIFASRSAQWVHAQTKFIKNCFGHEPQIIRLKPLIEVEQRQLFETYKPEESFFKFQKAIQEVDLEGMLGNPQFLQIFAKAYVNNEGGFTSKSNIFRRAIETLATERNEDIPQEARLPIVDIIAFSEQVFAKLLLSGATGLSYIDAPNEKDFPFINTLIKNNDKVGSIINTGLFKPSQDTNNHEPVHRIIAEYCAAQYLVKRLEDSSDLLTMKRCLAIIAPNTVVRDDLRGLFAWMAAVGGKEIQEQVIQLDPYAIFSNGDPTRLANSSKKMLLEYLGELDKKAPYFRAEDRWRTFSTSGFFTEETIEIVKTLLTESSDESHLRALLLELLKGSLAVPYLKNELRTLLFDNSCNSLTRKRANECFLACKKHDHQADLNALLNDKSADSLMLAAQMVIELEVEYFGQECVFEVLLSIGSVFYPIPRERTECKLERYFIPKLIKSFEESAVVFFLDSLSENLTCTCEKRSYQCQCREGKSYLIGELLNQLFEVCSHQPTAQQIYDWTKSVNLFCSFKNPYDGESLSLQKLQENHELRQEVHLIAFSGLNDREGINERFYSFDVGCKGLLFRSEDYLVIVDYAFDADNLVLWSYLIPYYPYRRNQEMEVSKQQLRAHMRKQAKDKPEFNKVWTQRNREWKEECKCIRKNSKVRKSRRMKRVERENRSTVIKNQIHFDQNIKKIESGCNWNWLCVFAYGYLSQNTENYPSFKDKKLPEKALQNCFPLLKDKVSCTVPITNKMLIVLQAACLVQFRNKGHLSGIDLELLKEVKKNSHISFGESDESDKELFDNEINRHLFKTKKDTESFVREWIEPQLEDLESQCSNVAWLLNHQECSFLKGKISLEWLVRFPYMGQNSIGTLFDDVVSHGDVVPLKELIKTNVEKNGAPPEDAKLLVKYNERRDFWLLRQFFFIDGICNESRDWLEESQDRIFDLEPIIGSFRSRESTWPSLSAEKTYLILDLFIESWPKVFLPSHWGSSSPPEEIAYRLLKSIIWNIGKDKPINSIPVLEKILQDKRFSDYHNDAKHLLYTEKKKLALQDYEVPSPNAIIELLDGLKIASVEDLRAFLIEALEGVQQWVVGGETDGRSYFYEKGCRVDENKATKRIVDKLEYKCKALGLPITIEHQLANNKRCDFTVRCNINGSEKMLVVEVKGQWHRELYTAAAEQLCERYSIHPSAEGQGIFLVLWFGGNEKIAGRKGKTITTPEQLKDKIIEKMPSKLHDLIDVFVLDLA